MAPNVSQENDNSLVDRIVPNNSTLKYNPNGLRTTIVDFSYFLFNLNHHLGAINAAYVEEVFALPELILIPDAPLGVIGVLDLRGDTLPILDLQLDKEEQQNPYQLTDSIIVLNQDQLRVGIIVNAVHGIRDIPSQGITTEFYDIQDWMPADAKKYFAGMVTTEETIYILSEPKDWFNAGEIQQVISVTSFLVSQLQKNSYTTNGQPESQLPEGEGLISKTNFCPTATPEERLTFQQRAENLRQSLDEGQSIEGSKTLVVIALNDNLFGIDSQLVREFITINQATPIPCCPEHIIGTINLRGEILTIIDICKPLNFSLKNLSRRPKAIVVEVGSTAVGVVVEDVRDATFPINLNDIKNVSDIAFPTNHAYLHGIIPYDDQTMHILNLPNLLLSNELVVDEMI